ncbi:MAG: phosphoribosylamine--glycine ligase [Chloroflexi bacterium]|nr:phosphoribosylamine--glycine ligase [Chloroflexota bacterium]
MRIGLVGDGGREHAIAVALTYADSTVELFAYMHQPNPGIVACAKVIATGPLTDVHGVAKFFQKAKTDVILIGPETPLAAGLVDVLAAKGLAAVGPTARQARLESDKGYMRRLLRERVGRGYPDFLEASHLSEAAAFIRDHGNQVAVKPVGLTGGKGVRVLGTNLSSAEEALAYAQALMNRDGRVLLEERLIGEEFSLMAFSDGQHLVPMPLAQDFKYVYDGDLGGMTGGMGAYTCADGLLPFVMPAEFQTAWELLQDVIATIEADTQEPYRGVIYGQFMLTAKGPLIVECNVRFGDPEAINVLAVLDDSLGRLLPHWMDGTLSEVTFRPQATVSKYLVPPGYPESSREVFFQLDLSHLEEQGVHVRFASLRPTDGGYYTASSRTFALLALADSPDEASTRIEEAITALPLNGLHHRRDVGDAEVLAAKVRRMEEIRAVC